VAAVDEQVRRRDHTAVRSGDDRRVITGAQHNAGPAPEPLGDAPDDAELAGIGNRDDTHSVRSDTVWTHPATLTLLGVPVTVQAYILIQTEVGKAAAVAAEIANIKGVTMAEDVTGPYDVIVRSEARSVDELGKLVVAKVQAVPGITRTLTCPVVHL
jgi:DNA-binding Lrp family transcriptional regulator